MAKSAKVTNDFETYDAVRFGVCAAILLKNIRNLCRRADGDGFERTSMRLGLLRDLLPYMSEPEIRRSIAELVECCQIDAVHLVNNFGEDCYTFDVVGE